MISSITENYLPLLSTDNVCPFDRVICLCKDIQHTIYGSLMNLFTNKLIIGLPLSKTSIFRINSRKKQLYGFRTSSFNQSCITVCLLNSNSQIFFDLLIIASMIICLERLWFFQGKYNAHPLIFNPFIHILNKIWKLSSSSQRVGLIGVPKLLLYPICI